MLGAGFEMLGTSSMNTIARQQEVKA